MLEKRKIFREGEKFGKLLVINYAGNKKYKCICDCGTEKIFYINNLLNGNSKSCGCIDSVNRSDYDIDSKIKLMNSIDVNKNGCWEWNKSKHKQGYGNFCYKNKVCLAHRISWLLFKGSLNEELLVCHSCDNPACVNPDHLFLGTNRDNTLDCIKKRRANKANGEKNKSSKLKKDEVQELRSLYDNKVPRRFISEKFGISLSQIWCIGTRKSWKHI